MKKPEYKLQWTATGFIEQYEYNMTLTNKYIEAYYMTEQEHQEMCGDSRYSGYHSFENLRRYHYKKKQPKKH